MRFIAWFLTIVFGLAGLALRVQGGFAQAQMIGTIVIMLGGLVCPAFWMKDSGLLAWVGATRRDRLMFGFAFVLAMPLILF
ncbi:MAG TPA: hypothetical protein VL918_09355 [Sphingobium sp.]|nr:hypothetical protein [Sphingobium sp.]